jgi:hypothetical protein
VPPLLQVPRGEAMSQMENQNLDDFAHMNLIDDLLTE